MEHVYVIIENGEPYLQAYRTYKAAVAAVKEKHKEYIEHYIKELADLHDIEHMLADINVPEAQCMTRLYIEKGINIQIHKLPF
jgi:hypothetical protein